MKQKPKRWMRNGVMKIPIKADLPQGAQLALPFIAPLLRQILNFKPTKH